MEDVLIVLKSRIFYMNIFNSDGSYNTTSFKGSKGIWHLQATESGTNGIWSTIDTFTDYKGNYTTVSRAQLKEWEQNGGVTALPCQELHQPHPSAHRLQ